MRNDESLQFLREHKNKFKSWYKFAHCPAYE